tara:strand:- start:4627 stop:4932 length:306 start_codon:yes stop_codon:yes gene_type:complete
MPDRSTFLKQKRKDGKRIFQYAKYPEIPLSVNDIYVTTTTGDRLDLLADQFYNNSDYWWIISSANPDVIRRDSIALKEGIELRIPSNYNGIISDFENLNKE